MSADGSQTVDVLRYETPDGPSYRAIESGRGDEVVAAHEREVRQRRRSRWGIMLVVALVVVGYSVFVSRLLVGAVAGAIVLGAAYWQTRDLDEGAVWLFAVSSGASPSRAGQRVIATGLRTVLPHAAPDKPHVFHRTVPPVWQ